MMPPPTQPSGKAPSEPRSAYVRLRLKLSTALTPSRPRTRGIWPSIHPPPCPSQIGIPTLDQAFARSSGPVSRATLDPDIAMDGAVSILRPETGDKHGCE